jgi:hypothetical protein
VSPVGRAVLGAVTLGVIVVAMIGCDSFTVTGINDLEAAKAQWRTAAVTSYTYSLRRSCFCPPESVGPVEISVVNGQVVQRTLVDTGASVTDVDRWPDVEGLFEYAERALREADEVTVDYHPDYGFPVQVNADWIRQAVDDEENLTVLSFALPESE